eukprot:Pgem_evm1s18310
MLFFKTSTLFIINIVLLCMAFVNSAAIDNNTNVASFTCPQGKKIVLSLNGERMGINLNDDDDDDEVCFFDIREHCHAGKNIEVNGIESNACDYYDENNDDNDDENNKRLRRRGT